MSMARRNEGQQNNAAVQIQACKSCIWPCLLCSFCLKNDMKGDIIKATKDADCCRQLPFMVRRSRLLQIAGFVSFMRKVLLRHIKINCGAQCKNGNQN